MDDKNLMEKLAELEPPTGSSERAKQHLNENLRTRNRRRLGASAAAVVAAVATGLVLTPAGSATVDFIRDFVSVEPPDQSAQPLGPNGKPQGMISSFADVARGEFPDGTDYTVRITRFPDDKACPGLSFSGVPAGSIGAAMSCDYGRLKKNALAPLTYLPLASGNVVGYALARPEIVEASVSREGTADVVAIRGELEVPGEAAEPLPPASLVVFWLPEGAGEAGVDGAPIELELKDAGGTVIAAEQLRYVSGAAKGLSVPLVFGCDFRPSFCADAESGESERVDKKLGRELPTPIKQGLKRRGYTYQPASDLDRELPLREKGAQTAQRFYKLPIDGAEGLAFLRLGRLSGHGLDNRLVFLFHYFDIERKYRQGGGYTDADSVKHGDPLKGEAYTYILDGETGKRLRTIKW